MIFTLRAGVVRTSNGISLNEVRVMETQKIKIIRTRVNTARTCPPSKVPIPWIGLKYST